MLPLNSGDKHGLPLESGIYQRASPGPSRVHVGVGQVNDENQQNLRIQQAVNRYNGNIVPPFWRSSGTYKCSLFKSKSVKPLTTDHGPSADETSRLKPENRYASAGHFPTVILGKPIARPSKKQSILSHLRANSSGLPVSRFMDDYTEKYSDLKSTRSVLDVLQDLSRKRIHGKDETDDIAKRTCKGLGGDLAQEGVVPYKPLFVSKPKLQLYPKKDQTTQTFVDSSGSRTDSLSVNETNDTPPTPQDSRWELRKRLAQKNNEIFASLSSSLNGIFSKRKRAPVSVPEKESRSSKKQKVVEIEHNMNASNTPKSSCEKRNNSRDSSMRSPPTKDRLMGIYWDLQNAGNVKENVLKSLQVSHMDSQFQRPTTAIGQNPLVVPTLTADASPKTSSAPLSNMTAATPSLSSDKLYGMPPISANPATSISTPVTTTSSLKPAIDATPPSFSFGLKKVEAVGSNSSTAGPLAGSSSTTPINFNISPIASKPTSDSSTPLSSKFEPHKESVTIPGALVLNKLGETKTALETSSGVISPPPTEAKLSQPPIINFGADSSKTSAQVPNPIGKTNNFSFGLMPQVRPAFSMDKPEPTNVPSSTLNFGQAKTDTSNALSMGVTFGQIKSGNSPVSTQKSLTVEAAPATTTPTALAFGQGNLESATLAPVVATTPSLDLNKAKRSEATDSSFSFGQAKSPAFGAQATTTAATAISSTVAPAVAVTSSFSFGQPSIVKSTNPAPTFSFGQSKPAISVPSGFAFGKPNSNEIEKPNATLTSTATVSQPSSNPNNIFNFGNKSDTKPVQLGSNDGSANSTAAGKPFAAAFMFGSTSNATTSSAIPTLNPPINTQLGQAPATFTAVSSSSVFARLGKPKDAASTSEQIATTSSASSTSEGIFKNTTSSTCPKTVSFAGNSEGSAAPLFGNSGTGGGIFSLAGAASTMFKDNEKSSVGSDSSSKLESTTTAPSIFGQTISGSLFAQAPVKAVDPATVGRSDPKVGFSFGQPAASTAPTVAPSGTFTFGAPAATNVASETTATSSKTTFGAPVVSQQSGSQATSAGFNFGADKSAAGPSFTFGKPAATQPFAFGSSQSNIAPTPAFGGSTTNPPSFGSSGATGVSTGFGNSNTAFGTTRATPAFGTTSSTPAFGTTSSTPAFGTTSSTPTFGATSSTPAFGTANSTPAFGATSSASAFGTTSSTPAFGTTSSTPAFGTTSSTPAFGTTSSTPAFGATSSTPAFGTTSSNSTFGASTAFGAASSTPAFGSSSTTLTFGTATPAFGNTTTPNFLATTSTSTANFGTSATPLAFGASTSTPTFGITANKPAFGSSPAAPAFGSGTAGFGSTATSPAFGNGAPTFGATSSTPNFSGTNTASPFGSTAAPPAFGSTNAAPAFGNTVTSPAFGNVAPPAYGSTSASFGGVASSPATPAFGSNPNTASTPAFGNVASTGAVTPFAFGTSNSGNVGAFNFGASTAPPNQTAASPFNFGSGSSGSGNPGSSVFNFGANSASTSGGAFSFGSNSSGFSQTPTPGSSGFSAPGTFSIGSGSSQPRSRTASRRRRP